MVLDSNCICKNAHTSNLYRRLNQFAKHLNKTSRITNYICSKFHLKFMYFFTESYYQSESWWALAELMLLYSALSPFRSGTFSDRHYRWNYSFRCALANEWVRRHKSRRWTQVCFVNTKKLQGVTPLSLIYLETLFGITILPISCPVTSHQIFTL